MSAIIFEVSAMSYAESATKTAIVYHISLKYLTA